MNGHDWREALYSALMEPIGALYMTDDFDRARQRLYAARKKTGDPELDDLRILASPLPDGNLIIVKQHIMAPGPGNIRSTVQDEEPSS